MNPIAALILAQLVGGVLLSDQRSEVAVANSSTMAAWAEGAYRWSTKLNCTEQIYLCEESCLMIKLTGKPNFRIYGVLPTPERKVGIVFPDGDSHRHKSFHDGVLVLDPFPAARFGHPVLVFYVDVNATASQCDSAKGFIVDSTACLQPVNPAYSNKYSYYYRSKMLSTLNPPCNEVVFLPLVHLQTDLPVQKNDRLQCFSALDGFNQSCPELRSKSQTNNNSCDPLLTNRDCGFSENSLDNTCSTSQTCDHAVLLSGGWNRQLSDISTYNNIIDMKNLLVSHGYLEDNIEIFYANGAEESQSTDEDTESYYPSSLKTSMRSHIRTVCDSEYCSDTLFIYLNSPTKPDGSSLLWDTFDNGMYDEAELYTTRELMRDIAHCAANRVIVMADQSYGGPLVAAAEARFTSLANVAIFTSADKFDWNTTKDRLTKNLLRSQQHDICLNDFKNTFYHTYKSPTFTGSKPNLLNSTLVGGPCTGSSMSLNDPEAYKYRGCTLSPLV